ncbi:MAG: maleylpyruvate isomerase family mycothiol-dependent enzyme [Streptosporangiaceae bacterium]
MSDAIEATRADRAALLEICRGLTPAQWQAASGCPGWSVQDVVAHLATGFWATVDQSKLPDITGQPFERGMEILVESRRGLSPEAVLADYEQVSSTALDQLPGVAGLDLQIPLGEAGTYPAALIPHAYAFDHYTHIRADLFAPRGALDGEPPPSDELRVGATLAWIEAALPQQNTEAAAQATLELQVTGAGGRMITFGSGPAKATVTSDGPAFVRWVTQRAGWEDTGVQASGDEAALAAARRLRVY